MPTAIKEFNFDDSGAEQRWLADAYRTWLQELAGGLPAPAAEFEFLWQALQSTRDRRVFLVLGNDQPAGFMVVDCSPSMPLRRNRSIPQTVDYRLVDLYLQPASRGLGLGSEAARLLWRRFHGCWEISVRDSDHRAINFWRKAITRFTNGDYSERRFAGWVSQRFRA